MTRIKIIVVCLFLTSCISVAPVVNPNSEISLYGVSSLPPQNGDWTPYINTGYQMSLVSVRQGLRKNESRAVNVFIYQLPEFSTNEEFLSHVAQGRSAKPNIGRFEIQKNSEILSSLRGADCVKYHSISKDKSAQIQGGGKAIMLLEIRGFHCKHPKNQTVGVNIEYSLRHYPETIYPSFEKNANKFFGNIKFHEF